MHTIISSLLSRPGDGKAAVVAQNRRDEREFIQEEDAGTVFTDDGEQAAGPSQAPIRVPPAYSDLARSR